MSKSPFQGLVKAGLPSMGPKGIINALGLSAAGIGAAALAYNSVFTGATFLSPLR
jgi:hypothetical protein